MAKPTGRPTGRPPVPPEIRFWARVKRGGPSECWEWLGSTTEFGYGWFRAAGTWGAHRYSWTLHFGPIPDGMCVLHRCDNPRCCNPAHLWLGTNQDNNADCFSKGRMKPNSGQRARGEQHGLAKLDADAIREIRRRRADGAGIKDLGVEFGVNHTNISSICLGKTWRHVK